MIQVEQAAQLEAVECGAEVGANAEQVKEEVMYDADAEDNGDQFEDEEEHDVEDNDDLVEGEPYDMFLTNASTMCLTSY